MSMESHKEYNDAFNGLPYEVRCIAVKSEICTQINYLYNNKKRLKEIYLKELEYINDRIKILEKELRKDYTQK